MTDSITTQIVGAHFRPPAKALLACLPAGHQLWLRPELTNEYDQNAVQVLLRSDSLRLLCEEKFFEDELIQQLAGQGFDLDTIAAQEEWHLGYLPRAAKGNQALEAWNIQVQQAIHAACGREHEHDMLIDGLQVACLLCFDIAGKPACVIPWPPTASIHDASASLADELQNDTTGNLGQD